MSKRTIFNGRLEFKNVKSFERVRGLYEQRIENFYKDDILFLMEDMMEEGVNAITIPKHVGQGTEKSWNNTVQLLQFISQYAISGKVQAWMTENGRVLLSSDIEPDGDKAVIINYRKGLELQEEGKANESIEAFDRAIDKYDEHSLAMEKRAYSKLMNHDIDGAEADFIKSIGFYAQNPEAYLGRSRVHLEREKYVEAIADLELALKFAVPMQPVFWKARRLKGKAHLHLQQFDKASFELKFFSKRAYTTDDPNYRWKRASLVQYGLLIWSEGDPEFALTQFKTALDYPSVNGITDKEIKAYLTQLSKGETLEASAIKIYL